MKTSAAVAAAVICFFFVGAQPVPAQDQTAPSQAPPAAASATAPAAAPADPVKAADIQRLIEVAGMKQLMVQTMDAMETNVRPNLESALPPGEYRARLIDLFFEKFRTKLTIQEFLDMAAAAYDKYLTDDDIKGLIQFYQTPLGQKTLTILPKLTAELQAEGMQKGEEAGRDSMNEVLAEHPDLAKALQDASQGNAPPPR
ncbi:MAG: DUF2059 domain-containing protein [Candidatus Acidiferrales bacterium]